MLNLDLSADARILYYLIDDQSGTNGESRWHWTKLAIRIGVGHTKFFSLVNELTGAGCLLIQRQKRRVTYIPSFRINGTKAESHSAGAERVIPHVRNERGPHPYMNQAIEPEPPLPPASGGNGTHLDGFHEGCTICPLCGGRGEVVLRRARAAECRECGGRGFIDPTWFRAGQTVSIGAKTA